ncbi:MAG: DUF2726 domain-containing protein [Ottowia sp.]|uniref:DUF2726 domain-containing protein n=1 Tax=Ottowia sp. TaxID=1898956 RepID=UPI0039E38E18
MEQQAWWWSIALLALLALIALWWRQRSAGGDGEASLAEGDQFSATAALSQAEMELLDYLVRAFPGRPVLFRSALSHLVAVRKAQSRLGAQQRLATHVVDYVVCNRGGVPVYAFELDAMHEDTAEAEQDALEKHRVLKTAGIRLIRLKRTTRDLPDPARFRRLLRAAALPRKPVKADAAAAASAPGALEPTAPHLSDTSAAYPGFSDTVPMTVTGLMSLQPADDEPEDDPWAGLPRSG